MADQIDRRAMERLAVNADTNCAFVSPVTDGFGSARIRDVSMDGIGLILTRKLEVNSLLAVTIANAAKGFSKTLLVRVTHVTQVHGGFLAGGVFSAPLSYQEFTTLVM